MGFRSFTLFVQPTGLRTLLPTVKENLAATDGSELISISSQEWVKQLRDSTSLEAERVTTKSIEVLPQKFRSKAGGPSLIFLE